jgi:hypothetical protein
MGLTVESRHPKHNTPFFMKWISSADTLAACEAPANGAPLPL